MNEEGWTSGILDNLTVERPDREDYHATDVRITILPGGALRVFRDYKSGFSDAVPFEKVLAAGTWTDYHAYPRRRPWPFQ
jgi:hypothetical protein